jgi:opacity protein-like surface antigen
MRPWTRAVILTILLVITTPAPAAPRAGDWEVGLDGGSFRSDLRRDLDIRGSLGFFLLDFLEIGIRGGWHQERWKGTLDEDVVREPHDAVGSVFKIGRLDHGTTRWDLSLFAKGHVDTGSPATPYVGALVGYERGRLDSASHDRFLGRWWDHELETFHYGILAGVKLWLDDRTAVFGEVAQVWRDDPEWRSGRGLRQWAESSTGAQTFSVGFVRLLGPDPAREATDSGREAPRPDMSAGRWRATCAGSHLLSGFEDTGGIRATIETFVAPGLSIGAEFAYRAQRLDSSLDDDHGTEFATGRLDFDGRAWEANAFLTYHLETASRWTPYIGAFAGSESATLTSDEGVGFTKMDEVRFERRGLQCGLRLGVDWWLTTSTSIFLEYRATYRVEDRVDGSHSRHRKIDDDLWIDDEPFAHGLGLGLSFLFG